MTTEDRQVLLAQLNSAYKLDDSDLADCKRQLVLVSGEFDCNKYYNKFFCIFMRWFVQEDGTKKIAPAQFVRVSASLENPKKHAETTNLFEEYKKIRNISTNKSEASMFLEKPNYLASKSVNDVMICPYCNSNNCTTDISRPSNVDAELFSDNTGNYSVKCYCRNCDNTFDLNLKFRYELTSASSTKRC